MSFEEQQCRFIEIEHMDRGNLLLVGVDPSPGVAAVVAQQALQICLAKPLERADEGGVGPHQFLGVVDF